MATPTPTMPATLTTLKIRTARLALPTAARQFSTSSPRFYRRQPGDPTGPNEPPTHISAPKSKSPLKVWPILAIFALGGFLFKKIVDEREGQYKPVGPIAGHSPSSKPATPRANNPVPH
ncbi:UMP/CMP kinase [Ascochyta rabiei]|uniref:ATP binding n=1 Tax=Didymella rabiei TaxID=5454 RepID=A0A163DDA5_DIDRA|nr:UMP/CMP kinase [Ascochyta rabiei]KZM23088.1 ATP binding [Ascochyta rabiei]UPX18014.1 UMP/CMP kinase [Ascochyta rabiei]